MKSTTSMDRQTFLAHLRRSKLLGSREFLDVVERLPETDRGRVVARTLVEWGVLTKFQAEILLAGRSTGFVLGQYRILDQLGQGGMGRVYKALHLRMHRTVALKVLAPQVMQSEKAKKLFQREVRAAGQLTHPNIVTAYDANTVNGRYFLVMEYVNGPNLDQLVRRRGRLPVGLACDLIRQAALGLQYAFERGMVHRDIKPANLLAQRGPTRNSPYVLKILDFGLARLHDVESAEGGDTILTSKNIVLGTPDFLSPEQARDMHEVDIRSDLYSLGCTFYFLLTGHVPFPGGSKLEKLVRHGSQTPAPVESFRPDISPQVAAIVRRMMAKEMTDRFQTPALLAAALDPFAVPGSVEREGAEDTEEVSQEALLRQTEPALSDGSDEESAPVTVPADMAPTPMSEDELPAPLPRRGPAMMYVLIWSGAIALALLLLVLALLLRP
jgi:serine/threonine-protein kinase